MPLVDLPTLKAHLRVDHGDDDNLISVYGAAAEVSAAEYLGRVVHPTGTTLPVEGDTGYDPDAIVVTPAIIVAVMKLCASMYEGREAIGSGDAVFPADVRALLAPWRVWRLMEEDDPADA